jgi:hypothetical protein
VHRHRRRLSNKNLVRGQRRREKRRRRVRRRRTVWKRSQRPHQESVGRSRRARRRRILERRLRLFSMLQILVVG